MIVVTGGAGFIGSNLVKRLLKEDREVVVVDNLHTGSPENVPEGVTLLVRNAGELDGLEDAEAIFHQGIYSSSPMYKEDPLLSARALEDFLRILEFCRRNDCRLVFASTSSLYNGLDPPHREDMPILVRDFYTEVRLSMERFGQLYSDLYGLDIVGLRYFSVYGPGEWHKGKYANTLTQFLWDIKAGRRPVIFGDGSQTRDFIFVEDVVRANLLAEKFRGFGIFNVGTGKSTSFLEVVEMLNKELGTDVEPRFVPNPIKNYVMHTQADTSLAEEKLGFKAQIPLEEGIKRVVEAYS